MNVNGTEKGAACLTHRNRRAVNGLGTGRVIWHNWACLRAGARHSNDPGFARNKLPPPSAVVEPGGSPALLLSRAYPKAPKAVKQGCVKLVMKRYKTLRWVEDEDSLMANAFQNVTFITPPPDLTAKMTALANVEQSPTKEID
ncbi:hypothetical protein llap_13904 [Limosa lapponica baueri]|uniref:Uncharacterized protein n=1 Tax=Limosa lapponica baueri TaxID=1758121 RepID=A0A2I0TPQ4_LIMLA|nr:hypothetical protein llap_13904 [Limosa lapponica baueri]